MARKFVFGDIHGSYNALNDLLFHAHDTENFNNAEDQFIFIGDYVDRGFQSKQVIDRLIKLKDEYTNTVFLRGNHEDMFMDYMGIGGSIGSMFIYNGGLTTLLSYVTELQLPTREEYLAFPRHEQMDWNDKFREYDEREMAEMVPQEHKDFLLSTKYYHDTDEITFVHGGVNPYQPLEEQTPFQLTWVNDNRPRFFSQISTKPWHKLLIHGHTVINPDEVKKHLHKNRINVDTGYVYGQRLSMLIIDDGQEAKDWKIVQYHGDKISWRT